MVSRRLSAVSLMCLALACGRKEQGTKPKAVASAAPSLEKVSPAPLLPVRLATLPLSAYGVSLALDDEAVFLLSSKAAYRFVSGEPLHAIGLNLGLGPVLTRSAFVFWENGAIWSAPKQGGATRKVAALPHQPQYFVAAGEDIAWVDLSEAGLYTIQTLDEGKPRVRVSSAGELSALTVVRDSVYFVQRPTDASFRIGVVPLRGGGEPEYTAEKRGRRPAMLSGDERMLYYYSLDGSELRELSLDLTREQVTLRDAVCSPVQVSTKIYCGCVEGLFEVSRESHAPRVLVQGRPGSITYIASNEKRVAWVVDIGADQLAVDQLAVSEKL